MRSIFSTLILLGCIAALAGCEDKGAKKDEAPKASATAAAATATAKASATATATATASAKADDKKKDDGDDELDESDFD